MRHLLALPSFRPSLGRLFVLALLSATTLTAVTPSVGSELRNTAIVRIVKETRPSVVSIHGQKTVLGHRDKYGQTESTRRVNGMGTGVVIDPRGYIITNHHVVDEVRRIQVTLASGKPHVARLISHDPITDLAIIKIDIKKKLPVITIGTSRDLDVGEPAIAIGNAYGYEHTITEGIISSLHRTVHVSDTQRYEDQIQTSAAINPGNSGGPLMNIDGEMIGINVAVRAGAQSIAFAIPVDKVMEVAAKLMSIEHIDRRWHGVVLKKPGLTNARVVVDRVATDSPAARGELEPGDEITTVGQLSVQRALDLERALLERKTGEEVEITVRRGRDPVKLSLILASVPQPSDPINDIAWEVMGLKLRTISPIQFRKYNTHYDGGLEVSAIRPGSPAARHGIRRGDVLLGMLVGVNRWETTSMEDVSYILTVADLPEDESVKFWILRGQEVRQGNMRLAIRSSRDAAE